MFEVFKPSYVPKRMWLAMVVIGGIGILGLLLMGIH
jgi:hypothetical protein